MFIESFEQNLTPKEVDSQQLMYREDYIPEPLNLKAGLKKWASQVSLGNKSSNSNLTQKEEEAAAELEAELRELEIQAANMETVDR